MKWESNMNKENVEQLSEQIDELRGELCQEQEELNKLAAECIKQEKSLADDQDVINQNKKVDQLMLTMTLLENMLANMGDEECG